MTWRVLVALALAAQGWVAATPPRKRLLRISPRVGDTLRMRFEQSVRATGPAVDVDRAPTRSTSMRVHSRSVVERSEPAGTIILAVTDSVSFDEPGADPRQLDGAQQAMRGRWARLRVAPTGAMQLLDAQSRGGAESALSTLPGTLPDSAVALGATWTREMTLPAIGVAALNQGGRLQVVFRFDSIGKGGAVAFVSMHGALARAVVTQGGARVETTGTMSGQLQVDLRRAWMTDSRAEFTMLSTMTPVFGTSTQKPMQLKVAITQRLHCND